LGKKRNLLNEKATGDIIVYMDDDDYYPPERISHAVDMLIKNPKALCAGASIMFIYFKHINKMIQFGPYGPNHSTAATFAFRRSLLSKTKFDEKSSVAEEKIFLKDYTIPFVQLDSKKSILVFSHNHNSFDKKELLAQGPNPTIHDTTLNPADFIKEPEILKFFIDDIDSLLQAYDPGNPKYKPDVTKQLAELKETRENMIKEHQKKQAEYQDTMNKINMLSNPQFFQNTINEQCAVIQQLSIENGQLQDKVKYLEDKIKQLINEKIQERLNEKIQERLNEKKQERLNEKKQEIVNEKKQEIVNEKRIQLSIEGPSIL